MLTNTTDIAPTDTQPINWVNYVRMVRVFQDLVVLGRRARYAAATERARTAAANDLELASLAAAGFIGEFLSHAFAEGLGGEVVTYNA